MLKFVQSCKLFRSPKHKGLNSPSYTCFCNYIFSTIVITVTWVNFIPPFQWISPIAFVFRKTPQLNELATKALSFEFKSVENMNLKFPIILLQHTWNYTLTFRFMFTNKIALLFNVTKTKGSNLFSFLRALVYFRKENCFCAGYNFTTYFSTAISYCWSFLKLSFLMWLKTNNVNNKIGFLKNYSNSILILKWENTV